MIISIRYVSPGECSWMESCEIFHIQSVQSKAAFPIIARQKGGMGLLCVGRMRGCILGDNSCRLFRKCIDSCLDVGTNRNGNDRCIGNSQVIDPLEHQVDIYH